MASETQKPNLNQTAIDSINASDSPFKTLGLPFPELNYNRAPAWNVLNEEIENSFRKLSVLVHPDKNLGSEPSNRAYQKLRSAHDELLDHAHRAARVKEYVERNTDAALGFVPERLRGAPAAQLELYRRKARQRAKKLNCEHFARYKGRIEKECRGRLRAQVAKRAEEEQRQRDLVRTEGAYFGTLRAEGRAAAGREGDGESARDGESAVLRKMVDRRRKNRLC